MIKIAKLLFALVFIAVAFSSFACGSNVIEEKAKDNSVIALKENVTDVSLFSDMKQISSINEFYSDNSAAFLKDKKGILISALSNGACATYNYALDLREIKGSLIEFEILKNETYEMSSLDITLIDIYDENNYISVNYSSNALNAGWASISAKTANSPSYLGFDNYTTNSSGTVGYTYYYSNFNGSVSDNFIHYPLNFAFDEASGDVSVVTSDYSSDNVVCLKDKSLFTDETVFQGFTTGQVYLKAEFKTVEKIGGMLISKIGNKDYAELIDKNLPNENLKFNQAYKTNNLHDGAVGYSYKLPVPDGEDMLFGNRSVTLAVKKDADGSVTTVSDYAFVPTAAGDYTATYTYNDNFANEVIIPFAFTVNEQPNPIAVSFENKEIWIGDTITLPDADISGGSGDLSVETEYFYNEEKITSDALLSLDKVGSVIVKVSAEDEIGFEYKTEKNYAINNKPLMIVSADLPYAVKSGEKIYLPEFSAHNYKIGEDMAKSVFVNDQLVDTQDLSYVVSETAGETLNVVYYADKGGAEQIKQEFSVNVIAPAIANETKGYFLYDESELIASTSSSCVSFTAAKDIDRAVINYAYALSAGNMRIILSFDANASNYEYLEITLTDYLIKNKQIKFRVKYLSGDVAMSFFEYGNWTSDIVVTDKMTIADEFSVYFDNSERGLLTSTFADFRKINSFTDGEPFLGFESGGVLVTIEAEKMIQTDKINLKSLSNQDFNTVKYETGDKTPARVYMFGTIPNELAIGTVYSFPKAVGFDAMSGQCVVGLSVYFPEGSANANIERRPMTGEHSVTFDVYGTYVISIVSYDGSGNRSYSETSILVADKVKPDLAVDLSVFKNLKLGKEFTLPTATVSDNYSATDKVECYVIVISQWDSEIYFPGDKITLDKSGKYTVRYVARDEAWNMRIVEISINI